VQTEQNQIKRSSRDKSLSFCFLLNNQAIKIKLIKKIINNAIAKEKSILIINEAAIILGRQIYLNRLPVIRDKPCLLYKKIVAHVAHAQKIRL